MDPSLSQYAPSVEEHEWDSDDFVIPSLSVGESEPAEKNVPEVIDPKVPPKACKQLIKEEEKIYLGPHGAPPSQTKQQDPTAGSHKQRFKHKLKEADRKFGGAGRENKVESLRELVGSKVTNTNMAKGSRRDWLDPHCRESEFDKYSR
ncbi:hypothetical protein J5N97_008386 [Dioscorea zingiberensis]|uniref:Uncharacterized protein n=1 Tax=Dioscorea zingiberensis TaxID=325984 RepID=A0A9D5HKZ0_9LILI|nr:hypothetical protein J5N97_008386 [Dioscorea zingiberensis]